MAKRRISCVYHCRPGTFWDKIFLDDAYNQALFSKELRFTEFKVLKHEDDGKVILREVHACPPLGALPAPVKKLAAKGAAYEEHGSFNKESQPYTAKVKTASLSDKISIVGEMWAEPEGDSHCRRYYEFNVNVDVFAIGGLIEKLILDDIEKSYMASEAFTNRWIREQGIEA